jgi:cyanophycinase
MADSGILLVGGGEVGDEALGRWLREHAVGAWVAAVATAAAFDVPEESVVSLAGWLGPLGFEVEGIMAFHRAEADLDELAARVAAADVVYVLEGSALHLRTAIKGTALLAGIESALARGALVVASGGAAAALCDPMVDPRGGAPTVGLGLVRSLCVVPHVGADPDDEHGEKLHRLLGLFPPALPVVALGERARCFLHDGEVALVGDAVAYLGGQVAPDLFSRS